MKASVCYILKNVRDVNEIGDINKELVQIKESLDKIKFLANKLNAKVIEVSVSNLISFYDV